MKALIHPQTSRQVEAAMQARSGSVIFHGPRGVGKAHVAFELSRRLNCLGDDPTLCRACLQHEAGSYPDLIAIRPEGKPSIVIEQVRGVIQALSLSLYHPAGVRVVIIDDAHALTIDAQNALLKLTEEPPPRTLFILVTDQPGALLPTVRSRCEAIYFAPIEASQIANLLTQSHNMKPSDAANLARTAAGAPGIAVALAAHPEEAAALDELSNLADTVTERDPFGRLLLAKRLIDSKADLPGFGRLLHQRLIGQLQTGRPGIEATVSSQLEALERFRGALQAKIAPRVAVERLMLEL